MIWFAQASETVDIINNVYAQWGAIGVLGLLLVSIGITLYRDNKALRLENKQSLLDRLADAKEFSKLEQIPKDELIKFIRNLYDVGNGTPGKQ